MPPGPDSGEPDRGAEHPDLDAERAATDHWRRVARQKEADYRELSRRPMVRAAVALQRRLDPIRRPAAAWARRSRRLRERALLGIGARRRRSEADLGRLSADLADLPTPPTDGRSIGLFVVGTRSDTGGDDGVDRVAVDPGSDPVGAVRRAIAATDHQVVGVMLGTSRGLDTDWLRRLVAVLTGDTVAAVPALVHPARRTGATAHDGRVRAAGLRLDRTASDVPAVVAVGAGDIHDPTAPVAETVAGSSAGIVFDRAAFDRAGGLGPADDLDAAVVELCVALASDGGRIELVPAAVVVDHRPVISRNELVQPVDANGRAWRGVIDRRGPAMWRAAGPGPSSSRFVLTVAAPSTKVAERWGDFHLAEGLADGLRRLGQEVRVQTADMADDPAGRCHDVHVVLRGLAAVRRTPGQRHVIWVISHPESIEDRELDDADLVLVASPLFAAHLRSRTTTRVEVMLQATDHRRFRPLPSQPRHAHDVTVVAKTREVLRTVVADALSVGVRPSIYGGGWRELVDPDLVVADHLANEDLASVYASAGVVLNDHWETMKAWGFVSNRLFDVLACGTPVISDPVAGIEALFDGAVLQYHDPDELRRLVDDVLADPAGARARAERGRAAVAAAHTLDHRATQLLALLGT